MNAKHTFVILAIVPMLAMAAPKNPDDPYEGYNRFMFSVNTKVDNAVMKPVARGYKAVTPKPVRTGVSNFFNNFKDVYSIGSNLLRADFKKAAEDTMRVAINSTWGLGGLIDIAGAAEMPNNKNSLGDTFATWGWKNSHYFVYPIMGPSTVRDAVGSTITSVLPGPAHAVFHGKYDPLGAAAVDAVNTRAEVLSLTDSIDEAALDPYSYTRDVFMQYRNKAIDPDAVQKKQEQQLDEEFDEEWQNTPADHTKTDQSNPQQMDPVTETSPQPVQVNETAEQKPSETKLPDQE